MARLYAVSVAAGEHGTLHDLEDDEISVIAARAAEPLDRAEALPGATVFVTCPSASAVATKTVRDDRPIPNDF